MGKLKKVLAVFLVIAVVSLSLAGCQDKGEHPSGGDHPSEHPAKEAPTE